MNSSPEPTDRDLWRRAVEGEPECFRLIFDRHSRSVHAYCARRTGSAQTADDLTSIVFLEAWRQRAEIDLHHESALPWLFGVANLVVRHRFRTTMGHRAALSRLPATTVAADHADDVAARIDADRRLARIKASFDRLSAADQDVLALCIWQGLDYATAAIALGVPAARCVHACLVPATASSRWSAPRPPTTRPTPLPGPCLPPPRSPRSSHDRRRPTPHHGAFRGDPRPARRGSRTHRDR